MSSIAENRNLLFAFMILLVVMVIIDQDPELPNIADLCTGFFGQIAFAFVIGIAFQMMKPDEEESHSDSVVEKKSDKKELKSHEKGSKASDIKSLANARKQLEKNRLS